MNHTGRNLFVAAALTISVMGCSRTPEQHFQKGVAYFKEQKYSAAARHLEKALAGAPPTAQALNFLGVCKLQEGKPDEATHDFLEAIKLDSGYVPARYNLALAALEKGQAEDAITQLRYVVQSDAAPPDAAYHLGLAYMHSSAWAQAQQALDKYLQTKPSSLDALNNLGVVSTRLRDYNKAKSCFDRCIAANAEFAPAYLNLAVLEQHHLGQNQAAADHYRKYLDLLPKDQQREDVRLALVQIEQELTVKPKPIEVASAQPSKPKEAPKTATTESSQTATLVPTNAPQSQKQPAPKPAPVTPPHAAPAKPEIVAQATPPPPPKRRTPVAPRVLKPGNRTQAKTYFNQAVQLQQQGKLAAAISTYGKAIAADPSYAQAHYNLAIAYRDSRQPDRALDNYELALTANDKFTDARYNYAILLQEQGYIEDAIAQYETLLQENPNDGSIHLAVAALYARDRATAHKARQHYEAYLKLVPNSPVARDIRHWLDQNR